MLDDFSFAQWNPSVMRAAVFHDNHDIRIDDVPEPVTGPGEVKIAVAHNGLCGADLREYLFGPFAIPTEPHPVTGAQLPLIMGHEFSGTIVEVGNGVTSTEVGDRVAVDAAGVPATALGTLQALGSRGRAVAVAVHGAPVELDPNLLLAEQT